MKTRIISWASVTAAVAAAPWAWSKGNIDVDLPSRKKASSFEVPIMILQMRE